MEQASQFWFDDVHVDVTAHSVRKGSIERALEPKAFAVLLEFLARPGELLTRDQLLDIVWGHRHVTPGVLNRVIANLRRVLGDDTVEPRYIATVHGLGYRFIGVLKSNPTAEPLRASVPAASSVSSLHNSGDAIITGRRHDDVHPEPTPSRVGGARHVWWVVALLIVVSASIGISMRRHPGSATLTPPRAARGAGLAVLPFSARSDDTELGAAVEGLSESLTDAFARTADLRVAGRESVLALGRGHGSVQHIADALDVDYVLSGEVQANANAIDLHIGLWRRGETAPVWVDEQSMPRDQLFRVVVPLIERVRMTVLPALTPEPAPPQAAIPAQDLYWLGRRYWYQRTPASLARALGYFQSAVAQDAHYALAYSGIADTYMLLYEYGDITLDEASAKAHSAVARAKELKPDLADAYASEGLMLLDGGDAPMAIVALEQALKLAPRLPNARLWYGTALACDGRVREARDWHARVEEDDPLNAIVQTYLGVDEMLAGNEDAATARFRHAIELDHDYVESYWQLAFQHELHGRLRDAASVFREAQRQQGTNAWTSLNQAYNSLLMRDADGAARLVEDADGTSPLDRLEVLVWARNQQGRGEEVRKRVEGLAAGAASAGRRRALLASIDVAVGRDDYARAGYDALFAANVGRGDVFFRPWIPNLGLGHFAAWIALLPADAPVRTAAITAYAAQLDRYAASGMRVPVLIYQRALLAALRGDASVAEKTLDEAIAAGWLDAGALERDPGWRPYAKTAWFNAAQQQLAQRTAVVRATAAES
ncbi:MAG: winged helix-turn-helix domain-containing protein [Dokdonella sp.]